MTSFIIDEKGFLLSCGSNIHGQLGLHDNKCKDIFKRVSDHRFITVSYGQDHVMAIDEDGCLWACGYNFSGQLGLELLRKQHEIIHLESELEDKNTFEKVSDEKFKSVSCGYGHTAAINEDGFLWAWGENNYGQLFLCSDKYKERKIFIKFTDQKFKSVSCGLYHTTALDEDGFLWGLRYNCYGIPCYDNYKGINVFEKISDQRFTALSCGGSYTMAIDEDKFLWARGENEYGQLGLGDNKFRHNFEKVSNMQFKTVSCGQYHTMTLDEDGCLWACGANYQGELGLGDNQCRNVFKKVSDQKFLAVSCGLTHTLAIDREKSLWACGANEYGQLGLGSSYCVCENYFVKVENIGYVQSLMNKIDDS